MPYKAKTENQATTNAYASILRVNLWDNPLVSIIVKNAHATNVADWKILVANGDRSSSDVWGTEKAEAQLAGNNTIAKYPAAAAIERIPHAWLDVQAKSNSAGNAALMYAYIYAAGK